MLEHAQLMREILGLPGVVRIEERHELAPRRRDRHVAGGAEAAILLNDVTDAVAKRRDRRFEVGRIRRSVIDDDDLEVGEGLREDRFQRLPYVRSGVVGGHDHADRRRVHQEARRTIEPMPISIVPTNIIDATCTPSVVQPGGTRERRRRRRDGDGASFCGCR